MKKITFSILLASALFSCKQPDKAVVVTKAPIDSLINQWNLSWNKHDSTGVRNMFANDALLIDDNLIVTSADEISEKWIHPNINVVNNFKSDKIKDWSDVNFAGYTGKYEFEAIVDSTVVASPKGVFTFEWEKNLNGEWKIVVAHIHALTTKQ